MKLRTIKGGGNTWMKWRWEADIPARGRRLGSGAGGTSRTSGTRSWIMGQRHKQIVRKIINNGEYI